MKAKVFKIKTNSGKVILISNANIKNDSQQVNISIEAKDGTITTDSIGYDEVENIIEFLESIKKVKS